MPCRIYASSLRSTCKTALIRHKHGKVYDQLSATQNNHLDDYDTWTDIRTLSQTLRDKNFCLRSGEMQFLVRVDSWYPHRKGCQIPCHVIRMTKMGSQGMNKRARSIQPNFPEISVQNSMDRFGPTGKVSKKRVHLLRWSSFSGRTDWNFGWMDGAESLYRGELTPPQSGHGRFNFLLREMWKTSLTWERGSWSYKFILYKTSLNEWLNNFHASKSSSWPPRGGAGWGSAARHHKKKFAVALVRRT